jgi:hypothetical protein
VHLGELFGHETKYKVIHKLGSGGFGNVWLFQVVGREPSEYAAMKILMAEASAKNCKEYKNVRRVQALARTNSDIANLIISPTDIFRIVGDNGTHGCFVYPVAGHVVPGTDIHGRDQHAYSEGLEWQASQAMGALHRNSICHGG